MGKSLLEELAGQFGYVYLSDLHRTGRRELSRCLRDVPAEAYSLREWNDAVEYLTGKKIHASGRSEAKESLLDALEEAASKG